MLVETAKTAGLSHFGSVYSKPSSLMDAYILCKLMSYDILCCTRYNSKHSASASINNCSQS